MSDHPWIETPLQRFQLNCPKTIIASCRFHSFVFSGNGGSVLFSFLLLCFCKTSFNWFVLRIPTKEGRRFCKSVNHASVRVCLSPPLRCVWLTPTGLADSKTTCLTVHLTVRRVVILQSSLHTLQTALLQMWYDQLCHYHYFTPVQLP